MPRLRRERLREARVGLRRLAVVEIDLAEPDERGGVARRQLQCALERGDRLAADRAGSDRRARGSRATAPRRAPAPGRAGRRFRRRWRDWRRTAGCPACRRRARARSARRAVPRARAASANCSVICFCTTASMPARSGSVTGGSAGRGGSRSAQRRRLRPIRRVAPTGGDGEKESDGSGVERTPRQ